MNTQRLIVAALAVLFAVAPLAAQHENTGVVVKYPQSTVSFHVRPGAADGTQLPFLRAQTGTESVGVLFAGIPETTPVIDLLDAQQKILRSVTAGDLMGKGVPGGVQLVSTTSSSSGNRALAVFTVPTPKGPVTLVLRGVASSDRAAANNPATLAFTISAKSKSAQTIGLRLHLPVQGTVEAKENGFAVSGKTAAAFAALISPRPEKIEYANRVITISGKAIAVGNDETPMMWFTVSGTIAAAAPAAKAEASKILADDAKVPAGRANIVIVTFSDKQSTAPGDTVTYSVVCSNIGTGEAREIELSNPVPAGTRYIAGSAVGEDTAISADAPAGTASLIRWKLRAALLAGQEKVVSFKVIVL